MTTNSEEIGAINAEARRRGVSYGKLVATLSWEEQRAVIHRAERAEKAAKTRKKRKKAAAP